ncbi:hypothetical protein A3B87_00150 [Candidatus Kuenenbacteria bacterium RIFCSPHIGHO2_02_FULL_39_13]|uniref:ECF transporter S component n=1 Tax=Candidatus Kuenenbacteria bacterium RIFCSPHIGHO2_02_FULL_39_13 TaxID=1798561 RepID=A0A1F6FN26_9BACT|nr:MAG: hypothetical protein A3B87_00150 [Candidatus Kuenenbacteria bacterium RIFCSPHIGHO2_02_FULL_39_13]
MFKFNSSKNIVLLLAAIFIFIGAAFRLLGHPPNFTPITAIALFGGVYLGRKLSLFLPILAMFLSDIFIGFYRPSLMIVVYGSFILTVILGWWLKNNKKWYNIIAVSLLASLLFYLLTNFAVWIFTPWYAKTLAGLVYCYYLALPFFRNTLMGNVFYVAVFFGSYQLVKILLVRFSKQRYNSLTI